MKVKSTYVFVLFLFLACTKENNNTQLQATALSNLVVDTLKIPLNDLGKGTYRGHVGGLYPNGTNAPSGTYATDLLNASKKIIPIDTFGRASSLGKVVFISLGGSTGGHNMDALKSKTVGNPATNPNLLLLKANNGSGLGSLNSIMNPNDPYWGHVSQIVHGAKSSYRQIQVVYIETDDSSRTQNWPGRANLVKSDLESCMRTLKQNFPNVKVLYVLGRTRTFTGQPGVKEPAPYYFGWGCKWAIEDQINGVPGVKYKGTNPVAPMITWGFYQWADSLPRITDKFYWRNSETVDGLHANASGQDTLSTRFQNFLLTDKYASIWYAKH